MATEAPMTSPYAPIIERLEKLTGPDREVNRDVYSLLFNLTWEPWRPGARKLWGKTTAGNVMFYSEGSVPNVTASLDATIALVEQVLPGWEWIASNNAQLHLDKGVGFYAELVCPREHGVQSGYCAIAAAPAIALCIALLKAMEVKP